MPKPHHTPFFDDESRYIDRFGLLLVATITALVVQMLYNTRTSPDTGDTNVGTVLLVGFVGLTFILALRASGVSKKWQRVADVIVFVTVAGALTLVLFDVASEVEMATYTHDVPPVVRAVLATAAPIAVIRRVASHRRVTAQTLIGAISAYLLIALSFSYIFVSIDVLQSGYFFGEPESSTSFTYFSMVTLTTLGYGDLSPSSDLGGLAATSEAVIGQVFLVTFVALLVGQRIAAGRQSTTEESDGAS